MAKIKTTHIKKAFLVVGRKNWGKSETLRDLSFVTWYKSVVNNGSSFFRRSSSNGDNPEKYSDFVKTTKKPYLILAFCCDRRGNFNPVANLQNLSKNGYKIYAFVLEHQHHKNPNKNGIISSGEIAMLKQYVTTVEIYRKKAKPSVRAAAFKQFIQKNIP